MEKLDILDRSLLELEKNTHFQVIDKSQKLNEQATDVLIGLNNDHLCLTLRGIITEQATKERLAHHFFSKKKKTTEHELLLVLDYAARELATFLQEKNINFIDCAGNAFIHTEDIYILIKGNSKSKFLEKQRAKRSFQETGLKFLFLLLRNPLLINENYRTLAELSQTSASSVGYVMEELTAMKFLLPLSKKERTLLNLPQLLERWAIAFYENLRPKIHRGYFKFKHSEAKTQLDELINGLEQTYIGGELAAEKLINYNRNHYLSLYSSDRLSELIKTLKIIPCPEKASSDLELLHTFWKIKEESLPKIVSPVLVYTDLINSFDGRNQETAKKILENELQYLFCNG